MSSSVREGILLPTFAKPRRYVLSLKPDLVALTFTGTVEIAVNVAGEGHVALTLHAYQLLLTSTPEYCGGSPGSSAIKATSISYDLALQTVTIQFGSAIPEGRGSLKLAFSGTLNDELAGFYRSKYTLRGKPRDMAVTQFEVRAREPRLIPHAVPARARASKFVLLVEGSRRAYDPLCFFFAALVGDRRASMLPLLGRAVCQGFIQDYNHCAC